jgi:integrase
LNHAVRKPHYMTATEQQRIEFFAPAYLKNIVVILVETGLRPYKELLPMKKSQVDLDNRLVCVTDSKTPSGVGELPVSEQACSAFRRQMQTTPGTEYLFPTPSTKAKKPYLTSLKKIWTGTLRRVGLQHFPLYELRHTFATRLSAGGVADHFVTQMLRQGDSAVFKRYSQAKLNMMRECLQRLDRKANEHSQSSDTPGAAGTNFGTFLAQ